MKQIGSQRRETLKEAGYNLVGRLIRMVILRPVDGGPDEIWVVNDKHAGYTVQVGRWGYEFVSSVPDFKWENGIWVEITT